MSYDIYFQFLIVSHFCRIVKCYLQFSQKSKEHRAMLLADLIELFTAGNEGQLRCLTALGMGGGQVLVANVILVAVDHNARPCVVR